MCLFWRIPWEIVGGGGDDDDDDGNDGGGCDNDDVDDGYDGDDSDGSGNDCVNGVGVIMVVMRMVLIVFGKVMAKVMRMVVMMDLSSQ